MLLVEPHGTTSCAIVNVLICVDIQEVEDPALEAVTEESSHGRKQSRKKAMTEESNDGRKQ